LIKGNGDLIFRAVRNLVENALKHAPPGSVVAVEVDEGIVRVSDEGPGVPAGERAEIFRRFWRRDRSRTDGSGLGLAIVSGIMAAHHGSIDVSDRPGGGAVFSLHFPSVPLEEEAAAPRDATDGRPARAGSAPRPYGVTYAR
jgi:signal transduction histidine kinase